MNEPLDDRPSRQSDERRRGALRKALRMVAWTVGLLVAFVVLAVLFVPAQFLEFRLSVLLKLGAGVLGTILLAAGLMAASFYSDESGHDDDAPGV